MPIKDLNIGVFGEMGSEISIGIENQHEKAYNSVKYGKRDRFS
jgi:hypothetical protein